MMEEAVVEVQAVVEEAVAVVVVAVVAVGDAVVKNRIMKKIIIHSIPILISFIGLAIFYHTMNPTILRGPDFLKFYFSLVIGFYLQLFI